MEIADQHRGLSGNWKILLGLVLVIYLLFAVPHLNSVFVADEVGFVSFAQRAWTEGMASTVTIKPGEGAHLAALIHPPTYLHLLGLFLFLGDGTEIAGRLLGLICGLATLLLLFWVGREIYRGRDEGTGIALGAALLWAIHPLAIQGSLLVDIDNTIAMPFILAFILLLVRFHNEGKLSQPWSLVFLGGLFGLNLWIKQQTPILLLLATFLFILSTQGLKIAFRTTLILGLVGYGLFHLTFALYLWVQQIPLDYLFSPFLYILFRIGSGRDPTFLTQLGIIKPSIIVAAWMSPWGAALALLAMIFALKRRNGSGFPDGLKFLAIFGGLVIGGYCLADCPYGFPRYQVPAIPMFALLLFAYLWEQGCGRNRLDWYVGTGVGLVAFLFYFCLVGDPLLPWYRLREVLTVTTDARGEWLRVLREWGLYFIPLATVSVIAPFFRPRKARWEFVLLLLTFVMASSQLALNVIQSRAQYVTTYLYGEQGHRDVVRFLDRDPNSTVWVASEAQELLFYLRQNHTVKGVEFKGDMASTFRSASQENPRYIVVLRFPSPEQFAAINSSKTLQFYYERHVIGDFLVFSRKR